MNISVSSDLLIRLKRVNRELNDLEALAGVADVLARPSHLEVDLNSRCNYRCPMCHQSKLDMGRYALSREQLDVLIDSLPYVDTVMIAGLGEPLLYPGLGRFLPWLHRYGCHAHLYTNGELIDRRLDWLCDLDRISISLDGATAATFETLRQGGHFERVVSNIRALRAAAPRAELATSTVVSWRNLREVADIVELAASLGMQQVHLSPVDHTPALELCEDDAPVFAEQLALAQARSPGVRILNNVAPEHFLPGRNAQVAASDLLAASRLQTAAVAVADALETWPERGGPADSTLIHGLALPAQQAELARRLRRHEKALAALRRRIRREHIALAIPYCSAPWKYRFALSRGVARLCPYADVGVGSLETIMAGGYNGAVLNEVRQSMRRGQPCLSVCRGCTDDHRRFRLDSLQETLEASLQPSPPLALDLLRRAARKVRRTLSRP